MEELLAKKEELVKEYSQKLAELNKAIMNLSKSAMSEGEWDVGASNWLNAVFHFGRKTTSAVTSKDRVAITKASLDELRASRDSLTNIYESQFKEIDKTIQIYRDQLNDLEKAISERDDERERSAVEGEKNIFRIGERV